MRIDCDHGYYSFYPERQEDLFLFVNFLGIELVKKYDHYTYPLLAELDDYTIKGKPYGDFLSTKTFEGTPKEIMKELDLVYSLTTKTLVPVSSIALSGSLPSIGRTWISERSMIQSGTVIGSGRILSYDGVFDFNMRKTIVRYFE